MTKKKSSIFICSFSSGLDDMRRADQRNPVKVLEVLHKCKRFSVFEATANQTIARTMTDLCAGKWSHLIRTTEGAYPWTGVELTDAGLELIGATE